MTFALDRLVDCSYGLQLWFWTNNFLLNPDKAEVTLFGIAQRFLRLPSTVAVAGRPINVVEKLKILAVTLDSTLSFKYHVNGLVKILQSTYSCSKTHTYIYTSVDTPTRRLIYISLSLSRYRFFPWNRDQELGPFP